MAHFRNFSKEQRKRLTGQLNFVLGIELEEIQFQLL